MKFFKGMKRHEGAGRKKGSLNVVKVLKVKDVLIKRGINPTDELIDMIPTLKPEDQLKAWTLLIEYTQNKPKEDAEKDDDILEMYEELKDVSSEDLKGYLKNPENKESTDE